ncbi:Nif11-like leader peptide family natural product precursor [Elusimicrobiota bacterium]
MSIESAKAFIEKMKTDPALSQRIAACKDTAARVALAKAEGFDFTPEEINTVSMELSPEDLEHVSGGSGNATPFQ